MGWKVCWQNIKDMAPITDRTLAIGVAPPIGIRADANRR